MTLAQDIAALEAKMERMWPPTKDMDGSYMHHDPDPELEAMLQTHQQMLELGDLTKPLHYEWTMDCRNEDPMGDMMGRNE